MESKEDQTKKEEKEVPKDEKKTEEPKKEETKPDEEKKKEESKEEPKKEEPKKEEPKKEETKTEEPKKEEPKKEEPKKEEDKKDEDNSNEGGDTLIKTKLDEKTGVKNAVEDKDLKAQAKTWDDLGIKPEIKKGLLDMDFIEPSTIQAISFPLIMKEPRLPVIAQAKNGSGKTGAFGLGVISSIDENSEDIQAVVLGLTRELIIQITDVLQTMAKYTKIKVTPVLAKEEPEKLGQIIVMTPVNFENYILKRNKKAIQNLKFFVLDEADEIMKNENTSPSIKRAFTLFQKEKMNVQVLFFSATFNNTCIRKIKDFYKTVYMIEVKKEELTLENVTQWYQDCKSPEDKIKFIDEYLRISTGSQKVIIFVNERRYAVNLRDNLVQRGRKVFILMGGDMDPVNRDETIRRFRKGEIQILITTNVLARGYDERSVKLVINFDIPVRKNKEGMFEPDFENYLHRIGRTGRFGSKGIGLNLCCRKYDYTNLQKIEKFYNTKIKKMPSLDALIEQLKNFYLTD